ncbi:hypothetical protein BC628DRAFT_1335130 [Trametes gibbosa]|nr:hypothetical protein BC628DRAFT_1335130 [Trametes gibbosa]
MAYAVLVIRTSKLRDAIEVRVMSGEKELDMAGWTVRTALELIGQGGLGNSFDLLTEEASDGFTEAVKAMIPSFNEIQWVQMFLPYLNYMGPVWLRRKLLDYLPTEIFKERKEAATRGDKSMLDRVGAGQDIMTVLFKANMSASNEDKLPEAELIAQMS